LSDVLIVQPPLLLQPPIVRLRFRGRDVADRLEQATVVEPLDPFERGELDGLEAAPGAAAGGMTQSAPSRYTGYRYPPEIISHAVWLYFRFPLSLRMVEEMLAARGITVSHETVRQWALKFGQGFANEIRRRLPRPGDKWHLDEVEIKIAGKKHWLWRAVDREGTVLDVLVQSRRDKRAAKRLLRKLLKRQGRPPRVLVTELLWLQSKAA